MYKPATPSIIFIHDQPSPFIQPTSLIPLFDTNMRILCRQSRYHGSSTTNGRVQSRESARLDFVPTTSTCCCLLSERCQEKKFPAQQQTIGPTVFRNTDPCHVPREIRLFLRLLQHFAAFAHGLYQSLPDVFSDNSLPSRSIKRLAVQL